MALLRYLILGSLIIAVLGAGAIAFMGIADVVGNVREGWGGGCHGVGYGHGGAGGEDAEENHHCHFHEEEEGREEYCPFHDEDEEGEGWEEHMDECPYHDDE